MFKKIITIIFSLFLSGSIFLTTNVAKAETIKLSTSLDFTIMTYNILHTNYKTNCAPKSYLSWSDRGPKVAEWINFETPDVVGIQENQLYGSNSSQISQISDNLKDYNFVYANESTNPIGYKTSVFSLVDSGIFQIAWKGKQGSINNRDSVYAVLKSVETEKEIIVVNTHLSPYKGTQFNKARKAQSEKLVAKIEELKNKYSSASVFSIGDYNQNSEAKKEKSSEKILGKISLVDSYKIAKNISSSVPGATSYNGMSDRFKKKCVFGLINRNKNAHIDYVYSEKQIKTVSWAVSSGPNLRKYGSKYYFGSGAVPSDHSPIIVEFKIPIKLKVAVKPQQIPVSTDMFTTASEIAKQLVQEDF